MFCWRLLNSSGWLPAGEEVAAEVFESIRSGSSSLFVWLGALPLGPSSFMYSCGGSAGARFAIGEFGVAICKFGG